MKQYLFIVLMIGLCLTSLGLAEMHRAIWNDGGLADDLGVVDDWFADKRPDMEIDPPSDIQDTVPGSQSPDRGVDNYNMMMWGWVTIPEDGEYDWWLGSDDQGALYVSTDGAWENVERVAEITGWQTINDWTQAESGGRNASSLYPDGPGPQTYAAGDTLAVWAYMTERGGGDHLSIGWIPPWGTDIELVDDHITIIEPTPTKATLIAPKGGDILRDEALLEWKAGEDTATHTLYFSTNYDDVASASADALIAEGIPLPDTSYDPGRLAFGTTYYWRVDEVAPDGTLYEGKIWEFTVELEALTVMDVIVTASSETVDSEASKTIDGSGLTDDAHDTDLLNMWLVDMADVDGRWIQYDLGKAYKLQSAHVWNHNSQTESFLGYGIKEARIETSLDGETWTELKVAEIPQATGMSDYTGADVALDGVMAQHVRITAISNYSILGLTQVGLCEVRFMYIPVQAREPQPADGVTTSDLDVVLGWRAGREVSQSEVVFSDDMQAVIDNTAVVGTVEGTSFDPGALTMATEYFWKINEVNEAETPSVFEGDLWSFLTPEDLVIDDMEMYKAEEGLFIWEHWIDGFDNPGENGAVVGNGDSPETSVVFEGSQALPLAYNNTGAPVSEATLYLDAPLDLTQGGAESLKLQIHGDAPGVVIGADTISVGASGADLWNAADEGRFVYKNLSGDGSITARVESLANVQAWAKAGVMIRANTDADSADAYTVTSAENGVTFQYRLDPTTAAASDTDTRTPAWVSHNERPVWVRVERVGNEFNGYISMDDGATWEASVSNPQNIFMGVDAKIGLCVTSHDINLSTVALFSNISTTGNVTGNWEIVEWGEGHPNNEAGSIYLRLADSAGKEQVIDHPNPEATLLETWDEWTLPLSDLTINATKLDSITVGVGTSGVQGKIFVDFVRTFKPYPVADVADGN